MKSDKFIKYLIAFLFIIFVVIYISSLTGYYEYTNNQKAVFTEESIKRFEDDIASGKNVNINDYLNNEKIDYSNKITDFGNDLSSATFSFVNYILKQSFKLIEKIVN